MAAKDYGLTMSELTGKVYIKKKGRSSTDKEEVSKSEFIGVVMGWLNTQLNHEKSKTGILTIRYAGKIKAEFKIVKEK